MQLNVDFTLKNLNAPFIPVPDRLEILRCKIVEVRWNFIMELKPNYSKRS